MTTHKFKVGDKVKFTKERLANDRLGSPIHWEYLKENADSVLTIIKVATGHVHLEGDHPSWRWHESSFDKYEQPVLLDEDLFNA